MTFDNILGNHKVKEALNKILESKNILHAYLFIGKSGIGKMIFAREFAKQILLLSEIEEAKKINAMNAFDNNNHPDYSVFEVLENENSISVEQIRNLNAKILEKPIESNKKVYVIKDAEKMTVSAQNALLKTLEEPPEYATIILVCNDESQMLTTIKSRVTKILFENLKEQEIIKYFEKQNIKLNDRALEAANGSIASAIIANENIKMYDEIANTLENMSKIEKYEIWSFCDEIYKSQDSIYDILDYIDIWLLKKAEQNTIYAECINSVTEARKRLKANANFNMTIDNLLLSIWEDINEKHSRGEV